MIREPVRGLHQGQQLRPLQQQAGHMTALDRAPNVHFTLASWRSSTHDVPIDDTSPNSGWVEVVRPIHHVNVRRNPIDGPVASWPRSISLLHHLRASVGGFSHNCRCRRPAERSRVGRPIASCRSGSSSWAIAGCSRKIPKRSGSPANAWELSSGRLAITLRRGKCWHRSLLNSLSPPL